MRIREAVSTSSRSKQQKRSTIAKKRKNDTNIPQNETKKL